MAGDDGGERGGQVSQRLDGIELASFDERGDDCPVLRSRIVPSKECVLPIEGYRPDGSLDAVVVDLDAAVGEEELQAIPVFGDVGQSLAEWRLRCDTGAVMDKPVIQVCDRWR